MATPPQNATVYELVLAQDVSMATDFYTIAQDIRFFQLGSMQIQWAGNDSNTGVFRPQVSIDQVCWCDLLSAANWATTSLTDNCAFYAFDVAPFPYMRLYYKANSNTAGLFTVKTFFKKQNTGG